MSHAVAEVAAQGIDRPRAVRSVTDVREAPRGRRGADGESGLVDLDIAYEMREEEAFALGAAVAMGHTASCAPHDATTRAPAERLPTALTRGFEKLMCLVWAAWHRKSRDTRFAVADAMEAVRASAEPLARARYVDFEQTCRTEAMVRIDRRFFVALLRHVLSHRVRVAAASNFGSIRVTVTDGPEGFVRIVVRGTGESMRDDCIPPWLQSFVAWRRAVGGAFVARWVVHRLVRRHGGRVAIESSASDTRVKFLLPLARRDDRDRG